MIAGEYTTCEFWMDTARSQPPNHYDREIPPRNDLAQSARSSATAWRRPCVWTLRYGDGRWLSHEIASRRQQLGRSTSHTERSFSSWRHDATDADDMSMHLDLAYTEHLAQHKRLVKSTDGCTPAEWPVCPRNHPATRTHPATVSWPQ
jgi:hypothetical protein